VLLVCCEEPDAVLLERLAANAGAALVLDVSHFVGQGPTVSELETWLLASPTSRAWLHPLVPGPVLQALAQELRERVAAVAASKAKARSAPSARSFKALSAYHKMQVLLACLRLDKWKFPKELNIPVAGETVFVETPRQVWQAGLWYTFMHSRRQPFTLAEARTWVEAHFETASIEPGELARTLWQYFNALADAGWLAKDGTAYHRGPLLLERDSQRQDIADEPDVPNRPEPISTAGPNAQASAVHTSAMEMDAGKKQGLLQTAGILDESAKPEGSYGEQPSVDASEPTLEASDDGRDTQDTRDEPYDEYPSAQWCEQRQWRWTDEIPDAMQVEAARTQAHWRSVYQLTLAELEVDVEARIFSEIPLHVARRLAGRDGVPLGEVLQFLHSAGYIEDAGLPVGT